MEETYHLPEEVGHKLQTVMAAMVAALAVAEAFGVVEALVAVAPETEVPDLVHLGPEGWP